MVIGLRLYIYLISYLIFIFKIISVQNLIRKISTSHFINSKLTSGIALDWNGYAHCWAIASSSFPFFMFYLLRLIPVLWINVYFYPHLHYSHFMNAGMLYCLVTWLALETEENGSSLFSLTNSQNNQQHLFKFNNLIRLLV